MRERLWFWFYSKKKKKKKTSLFPKDNHAHVTHALVVVYERNLKEKGIHD